MTDDVHALQQIVNDLSLDFPEKELMLDRFAALAMQALIGQKTHYMGFQGQSESVERYAARVAYDSFEIAEAMLVERSRRMKP